MSSKNKKLPIKIIFYEMKAYFDKVGFSQDLEADLNMEKRKQERMVMTMLEYLDKRKEKQSIDQNQTECYDT